MSDEVQNEGKVSPRKRARNISKDLLPILKKEYLESGKSVREIAEKYNLPRRALEVRCSRENWKVAESQVVEKVVKSIEKREDLRLKRLHSHEERMIKRMEERLVSVDKTIAQTNDLAEPSDLRSIVSTESTIDQVIRRNLGAEEKVSVSGSVNVNVVSILERIRERITPGSVIDVESEEAELSSCKLIEG